MEPNGLHKIAFICFSGAGALILVVLLAGLAPTIYCAANPSSGCQSDMSFVMAALGLCALGLAMVIGLVGIILSVAAILRQANAPLVFLSALSVLFDLVVFLPRALPTLQASTWVLIALLVYPPVVFVVSAGWYWRERQRAAAAALERKE